MMAPGRRCLKAGAVCYCPALFPGKGISAWTTWWSFPTRMTGKSLVGLSIIPPLIWRKLKRRKASQKSFIATTLFCANDNELIYAYQIFHSCDCSNGSQGQGCVEGIIFIADFSEECRFARNGKGIDSREVIFNEGKSERFAGSPETGLSPSPYRPVDS